MDIVTTVLKSAAWMIRNNLKDLIYCCRGNSNVLEYRLKTIKGIYRNQDNYIGNSLITWSLKLYS